MVGRTGKRKAAAGGAAVAALAVVGLVLLSHGDMPLITGAPPATDPDPGDAPPGGPLIDSGGISVARLQVDIAALDLDARVEPGGATARGDLPGPVVISEPALRALLETDAGSADGVAGVGRDDESGDGFDLSHLATHEALAPLLLALTVGEAARDQDRRRRRRSATPASVA